MTEVMELVGKDLKIAITNIIHMHKDAKNSINMREREDRVKVQMELLEIKVQKWKIQLSTD